MIGFDYHDGVDWHIGHWVGWYTGLIDGCHITPGVH